MKVTSAIKSDEQELFHGAGGGISTKELSEGMGEG